jgi:hypothetical protein
MTRWALLCPSRQARASQQRKTTLQRTTGHATATPSGQSLTTGFGIPVGVGNATAQGGGSRPYKRRSSSGGFAHPPELPQTGAPVFAKPFGISLYANNGRLTALGSAIARAAITPTLARQGWQGYSKGNHQSHG